MDSVYFSSVDLQTLPFAHAAHGEAISAELADELLNWFEVGAKWTFKEIEDFYNIHTLNMLHQEIPNSLQELVSKETFEKIKSRVEYIYKCRLSGEIDVQAQKMVSGNRIGIHTDYGDVGQSHRVLVQLNRGWRERDGGIFIVLEDEKALNKNGTQKYYMPIHRFGYSFEICENSFHAVSNVNSGERYTLMYSFRPA
ncbi:MAG: cyclophane-containing peptide 2OG-Fe(II) oxygenase YhhC [Pseudomonadota bacterium]